MPTLTHHAGLTIEAYHAMEAVSYSRLKTFGHKRPDGGWRGGSPFHYYGAYVHPKRPKKPPTANQIKGSAFGVALFEPERWDELVAVAPEINRRTNAGKAELAQFEKDNVGKLIIQPSVVDEVQAMVQSALAHPAAKSLARDMPGKVEASYTFTDEPTGLACKLRPDKHHDNWSVIMDAKGTSKGVDRDSWQRQVKEWDYHLQAAWNLDAGNADLFLWIVVEFDWPHAVAVHPASDECIAAGRRRYRTALEALAECRATGIWPGPEGSMIADPINLPGWCDD